MLVTNGSRSLSRHGLAERGCSELCSEEVSIPSSLQWSYQYVRPYRCLRDPVHGFRRCLQVPPTVEAEHAWEPEPWRCIGAKDALDLIGLKIAIDSDGAHPRLERVGGSDAPLPDNVQLCKFILRKTLVDVHHKKRVPCMRESCRCVGGGKLLQRWQSGSKRYYKRRWDDGTSTWQLDPKQYKKSEVKTCWDKVMLTSHPYTLIRFHEQTGPGQDKENVAGIHGANVMKYIWTVVPNGITGPDCLVEYDPTLNVVAVAPQPLVQASAAASQQAHGEDVRHTRQTCKYSDSEASESPSEMSHSPLPSGEPCSDGPGNRAGIAHVSDECGSNGVSAVTPHPSELRPEHGTVSGRSEFGGNTCVPMAEALTAPVMAESAVPVMVASSAAEVTPSDGLDVESYVKELEEYLLNAPDSNKRRKLLNGLDRLKRAVHMSEARPRTTRTDKTQSPSLAIDKLFRGAKELLEAGLVPSDVGSTPDAATGVRVSSLLRKILAYVDRELCHVSVSQGSSVPKTLH